MSIIQLLLKELDQEAQVTRTMLSLVPADKFDWKPHEKSMGVKVLATHVAELPSWITMALHTTELDFAANPYEQEAVNSTQDLTEMHEKALNAAKTALENAGEEDLLPGWTLRHGEQVFFVMTKYEVIRHSISQTIHHRAQLGVYLRLLDIPVPKTYGPTADHPSF